MLEKQKEVLKNQITDLNKAKLMCEKMLDEESISYEKLTDLHDYWKDNRTVFKLDSVSFLYIWGSMLTWTMITALCLIIGALSYSKLPTEIPVQWSKGVATSLVNKNWIFICTVICGHGNFYWIVSSWFGKNGFERERSFMIQILYFRNNNKILFFPRLL